VNRGIGVCEQLAAEWPGTAFLLPASLAGERQSQDRYIGNESVPTIFFLKLQSAFWISNHISFRVMFDKIASVYFISKNILIF